MNVLPQGRKQWLYFGLRIGLIATVLTVGAAIVTVMPGRSYSGRFEPLTPDEIVIRDNLCRHVSMLATSIGERNLDREPSLETAADYIESCLTEQGYGAVAQRISVGGKRARNIEALCPAYGSTGETLVVGAHCDSAIDSPGANDNATGVAAMLELARLLKSQRPARSVRFVAFANEEPPYFNTYMMGSRFYASRVVWSGQRISAMISLETIGCYSDTPGSQTYPFGFGLFYPSRGNFIAFVGNLKSRGHGAKISQDLSQRGSFPVRRDRGSRMPKRAGMV
jgi:hypothetical protein